MSWGWTTMSGRKKLMDKIVFLDIDGVLNNIGQAVTRDQFWTADSASLDKTSVGILNWICECTGASVVISSTWRHSHSDPEWYHEVFRSYDSFDINVVGVTPNLYTIRGKEIKQYVDDNQIENYVIIDDDGDMLPNQPFVHIPPVTGLTLYEAVRIIDMLKCLPEHSDDVEGIREHTDFVRPNATKT